MIEAMKQALEALETPRPLDDYPPILKAYAKTINEAITSLRQTIAEAEAEAEKQEPVAWMSEDECIVYTSKQVDGYFQHDHIPLYAHPQPRKPLTDEQIDEIADTVSNMPLVGTVNDFRTRFARAIEAAHGIKE